MTSTRIGGRVAAPAAWVVGRLRRSSYPGQPRPASSRTRRDQLDGDRLRDGTARVSDDVDSPAADVDERVVRGTGRVHVRRAGRIVAVVLSHGALRHDHKARPGVRVPAGAGDAPAAEAGIPRVLLDVEVGRPLRLDDLVPELRGLGLYVREDLPERGVCQRRALEA